MSSPKVQYLHHDDTYYFFPTCSDVIDNCKVTGPLTLWYVVKTFAQAQIGARYISSVYLCLQYSVYFTHCVAIGPSPKKHSQRIRLWKYWYVLASSFHSESARTQDFWRAYCRLKTWTHKSICGYLLSPNFQELCVAYLCCVFEVASSTAMPLISEKSIISLLNVSETSYDLTPVVYIIHALSNLSSTACMVVFVV